MLAVGTETVTVIWSPAAAVEASAVTPLTWTVIVEPGILLAVSEELITLLTSLVDFPSIVPARQPRRAALVSWCSTMNPRPSSINPNTNKKKIGATTANSTAEAARRRCRFDNGIQQSLQAQ